MENSLQVWQLFKKHGNQVREALTKMRKLHDDIFKPLPENSLLGLISFREYLKPEVKRLAESLGSIIKPAIGDMFARNRPKDEPDLNKKIGALLRTHEPKIQSEHPTVSFACAKVVPDHMLKKADLLIEAKYIRDKTPPSKATEGIAGDLTKYPINAFILFVVYDPEHKIPSDKSFRREIEEKGRNVVLLIR